MSMDLFRPVPVPASVPGGATPGDRHRAAPADDRLDRELRRMELLYRRSITARLRAVRRRAALRGALPDS
ncbi:MAG TPA: hypothetical protein VGK35_10600 [Actinotalea sp.]|jgi:hypothetical protein